MNEAITLDTLIRKKALAAVKEDIDSDIGEVQMRYFAGNTAQSTLFVAAGTDCICDSPDPRNPNVEGYAVNLNKLFGLLCKKALENVGPTRGNGAVEAFMKRVEQLGDEINNLRSEVVG